jgi:hypothetical protein
VVELDELKIPKAMRPVTDDIIQITDEVCAKLLDAEYADLARRAVAKLARKRPSPLLSGRRGTWAAAVVYALGQVNFLFDPSAEPHLTADELGAAFGIAKSTMSSKAKQVRDLLKMDQFSAEFLRADVMAENPMVWFVEVDGLIMDARSLPIDLQVTAFGRGYIPYIRRWGQRARLPSWTGWRICPEPEEPRALRSGVGEDQLDHGGHQDQHRPGGEHRPDRREPDELGGPGGDLAVFLADLLQLARDLGDEGDGRGGNHRHPGGFEDREPAGLADLERGACGLGHVLEQIPVFGEARPGLGPGPEDQQGRAGHRQPVPRSAPR